MVSFQMTTGKTEKFSSLKLTLKRPFVKKLAGGIFTQGLLSITHFILGMLVARGASKDEYAIYVIGFSTIEIFGSIQNALVNSPLTVMFPEKQEPAKEVLLTGLGIGQWIVFLPILLLAGGVIGVHQFLRGHLPFANTILVLLWVIPFTLLREFQRVVSYLELKIRSVLLMDVLFVIFALTGIGLVAVSNKITGANAIAVLGFAAFLSVIGGYFIVRIPYRFNWQWIKSSLKETWQYSGWGLIGIVAHNIRTYGYVYVVSLILSLTDTADLSASRLFLVPFGLFMSSSQRIYLAKGSQILSSRGIIQFRKFIQFFIVLLISIWVVWVLILWVYHDPMIEIVLGGKYENIDTYMLAWAGVFLVVAVRFIVTNSLMVIKAFKPLAIYGMISSSIIILLLVALLKLIGPMGALISLIAGDLLLLLVSTCLLNRSLKTVLVDSSVIQNRQKNKQWTVRDD